jgi:arginine decarboxylase
MGAAPTLIDVGGGLGVDYDGSRTNSHSSKNYSMQEYANDVVAFIQESCDEADVPHPDIVTESGRAMVAHHSVLVFDVLGVQERSDRRLSPHSSELDADTAMDGDTAEPKILRDLAKISTSISRKNIQESYHDVLHLREEASTLFSLGYLDLRGRARADVLFWYCCEKILRTVRDLPQAPEDLEDLEQDLADTYYGNLSVFQSAPDHWAVKQLFPVMPIHRLDERPTRRGVFADLTCDSDGKIDRFIDRSNVKDVLELHAWNGSPYYIGLFLVGAYQEILGDLHNLFGDTDAVHVRLGEGDSYVVEHIVGGDCVEDVLAYVQYDKHSLIDKVRGIIEHAKISGQISPRESELLLERYEQGLKGYTYLSSDI